MSVNITITLPDGYVTRILDNFAEAFNWTHPDGYGFDGYYVQKAILLKQKLKLYIKDIVLSNEAKEGVEEAIAQLETAKQLLADRRAKRHLNPIDVT